MLKQNVTKIIFGYREFQTLTITVRAYNEIVIFSYSIFWQQIWLHGLPRCITDEHRDMLHDENLPKIFS